MSSKTTSVEQQTTSNGDNVSDGFSTSVASSPSQESSSPAPRPQGKRSPQNLAEHINHRTNESGATVMILDQDNQDRIEFITNKFILQTFQMQMKEKVQLLETFDSSSVSFFGDTVKVYQFSGSAVDYPSTDNMARTMHQTSIIDLYDRHLRGTKLLESNNIAVMKVMNHLVYGYPMRMNVNYSAQQDKFATFNLSWVVTDHDLSVAGWVSDRDMSRLYSTPSGNYSEQQQQWISTLTALIDTVQGAITVSSSNEPSLENIKSDLPYTAMSGVTISRREVRVNFTTLQRHAFEYLQESWSNFGQVLSQRAENVETAINSNQVSSLGYESPLLSKFTNSRAESLVSLSQQATSNYESFEKYRSQLLSLKSLLRQLKTFKQRIING